MRKLCVGPLAGGEVTHALVSGPRPSTWCLGLMSAEFGGPPCALMARHFRSWKQVCHKASFKLEALASSLELRTFMRAARIGHTALDIRVSGMQTMWALFLDVVDASYSTVAA